MKISNFTIGADPEFFLFLNGKPYPIVGMLGGSKDNPIEFKPGSAMVEDNVMAEFNIPPCKTADQFAYENTWMIDRIMEVVHNYNKEFVPMFVPSVHFNPEYLKTEQAQEFGCMPDESAYSPDKKQPTAKEAGTLRTAGGHIHIGWEGPKTLEVQQGVARAFDYMVVLPFMLIEPENERRRLYGAPGAMRAKSYGVECRQLSCFWLSSEELMKWVFNQTLKALDFYNANEDIKDVNSDLCKHVRSLIEGKDLNKIREFVQLHELATV